jgi:hypothetical protein
MLCHECARLATEQRAVGQCRFCLVGLCKAHLVESFSTAVSPQYGCSHEPEHAFGGVSTPAAGSQSRARLLPDLVSGPGAELT